MATTCYFGEDFYGCVTATSAGESPQSAPSKWVKAEVPARLERAVVQLAYATLLPAEGQNDKRSMEERIGQSYLDEASIELASQKASLQSTRSTVHMRGAAA